MRRLRLAEQLDFDTFWVCDSHIIWNECYSMLGYLAASSQKTDMQFGTMVTNPVSRDPLVVASAFATLRDLIGDGRLLCGIGRGDSAVRVVRRHPAKIAEIELAIRLIQDLTGGKTATVDETTSVTMPWVSGASVPVYAGGVRGQDARRGGANRRRCHHRVRGPALASPGPLSTCGAGARRLAAT